MQLEQLSLRHLSRFSAPQLAMLCSALPRLRRQAFLGVVALRLLPVQRGDLWLCIGFPYVFLWFSMVFEMIFNGFDRILMGFDGFFSTFEVFPVDIDPETGWFVTRAPRQGASFVDLGLMLQGMASCEVRWSQAGPWKWPLRAPAASKTPGNGCSRSKIRHFLAFSFQKRWRKRFSSRKSRRN